ncbi:baseplate J/gp47 family protein [Paenibacillus psychroresistens]|uniref:Baseplate J/gp47 family protein n=1 Tax=Paenibacillus psychroresistens TaxID=1778678 RepID=A0A6B8RKD0_9BACL|nr:baseplate J/gp47 family protein [Paenibacillus psychroresistens]QGQ95876.1 baseplate J/gp47 family protein [Paenibacillus psychroresistens]
MSLTSLPDIQFIDTNPDTIRDSVIAVYEAIAEKKLYPGDPVRLFLLSVSNIIVQQRVLINMTAKQNLLRYALGDVLDHLGSRVQTERIGAQPADVTMRFTLSAPQLTNITVAAGTKVSPDGTLFFSANKSYVIAAGELYTYVVCSCLIDGEEGNGFVPGQINILVDPIAFVASVLNTTISSGGAEIETDDHYRERIYLAPEAFSVAGPTGAYEFWAKAADLKIIDVFVHSPSNGVVEIIPLMEGGALPDSDVLAAVLAKCNDKTIRPLTDQVQVVAPDPVNYVVTGSYHIAFEDASDAANIQIAVTAAVAEYRVWQKSKLGRDINPSELTRRILNAGAKRTTITAPTYTTVDNTEVANDTGATMTYGGVDSA